MTPERRNAIKGKKMSELAPKQKADVRECWLRDNAEHFPHGIPQYFAFLLDRLDERDARIAQLEDRLRENGTAQVHYLKGDDGRADLDDERHEHECRSPVGRQVGGERVKKHLDDGALVEKKRRVTGTLWRHVLEGCELAACWLLSIKAPYWKLDRLGRSLGHPDSVFQVG